MHVHVHVFAYSSFKTGNAQLFLEFFLSEKYLQLCPCHHWARSTSSVNRLIKISGVVPVWPSCTLPVDFLLSGRKNTLETHKIEGFCLISGVPIQRLWKGDTYCLCQAAKAMFFSIFYNNFRLEWCRQSTCVHKAHRKMEICFSHGKIFGGQI